MYLSMVPPSARIASESGSSRRLISVVRRSGSSFSRSDRLVKPRTSQNRIVRLRRSPPSFSAEDRGRAGPRGPAKDIARRHATPPAAAVVRAHNRFRICAPTTSKAAETGRTGGAQMRPKRRSSQLPVSKATSRRIAPKPVFQATPRRHRKAPAARRRSRARVERHEESAPRRAGAAGCR